LNVLHRPSAHILEIRHGQCITLSSPTACKTRDRAASPDRLPSLYKRRRPESEVADGIRPKGSCRYVGPLRRRRCPVRTAGCTRRIAMRPAIDGDGLDVARGIKPDPHPGCAQAVRVCCVRMSRRASAAIRRGPDFVLLEFSYSRLAGRFSPYEGESAPKRRKPSYDTSLMSTGQCGGLRLEW